VEDIIADSEFSHEEIADQFMMDPPIYTALIEMLPQLLFLLFSHCIVLCFRLLIVLSSGHLILVYNLLF